MIKNEVRVLGIDDVSFNKHTDTIVKVIGVLFRGGRFMDGVVSTDVTRDGDDATEKIAGMFNQSKFKKQVQYILVDGIAVAGFNVIDIHQLYKSTGLPVIVVTRKDPDFEEIHCILKRLGMKHKIELLNMAGLPKRFGKIRYQHAGCTQQEAEEILKITSTHSFVPEPIRVAHLIGQGISLGESKGRA